MLKPEVSVEVGLATAGIVWAVYTHGMPTVADVRGSHSNNKAVSSQRKVTTATAIGIVAGVSLLAHDPTVFILGGSMVVILDFLHRHANAVDPATNKVPTAPTSGSATPGATGVN
jgi:hypothetical protein